MTLNCWWTVALGALLAALPLAAAEYRCDFRADEAGAWDVHQEGPGKAVFADGQLRLDLRDPHPGKAAWVQLKRACKRPLRIEWEQELTADSPHLYSTGLQLSDASGHTLRVGPSGQALENRARLGNQASPQPLSAGRWYRYGLEITGDGRARLTVGESGSAETLWQSEYATTGLRGAFAFLGFFHNQGPAEGVDQYDQDRGATSYRALRVQSAAILEGDINAYRDADLRGYDLHVPLAFNRAMRWLGPREGVQDAVLAYDQGAELWLTGERAVTTWVANRLCRFAATGPTASRFTRPNDLDGPDTAAMPLLQWCVRQHPVLEYDLQPHAGACSLKVCLVEPYVGEGILLFRTDASKEPQQGRVDLQKLFEARGLGFHQFQEIAVYVYQDRPADPAAKSGEADVQLRLTGTGALVTTPPLVRTSEQARRGVALQAVVTGSQGELLHGAEAQVWGEQGGRRLPLTEVAKTGVFRAVATGLKIGEHEFLLRAIAGGKRYGWPLRVSVVEANYLTWQPGNPFYQRSGKPVPTLQGDLYSWVPVLDADKPERRVIVTADQWRALSDAERGRMGLIKQRSLTEAEIAAQLSTHRANGLRVLRLAYNVSTRESYLDAGGHVSMHGLETLAVVLRECRRLGMVALLNVFHYPYGSPGTGAYPAWQQYVDAGYTGTGSFTKPEAWPLLTSYLSELLLFLRDDPAMLGYSLTGEGDQIYGPEFINRLYAHVRQGDPNHLVTLEQGGGAQSCPGGDPWNDDVYETRHSGGLGYRTYYTEGMKSDAYFMLCGHFYGVNPPAFLAEVASGPGWHPGFGKTWTHPDFLTKVRDNCWASLLCRETMCITWSAPWTQEERVVPDACADLVDWSAFRRQQPDVALLVAKGDKPTLRRLADYEVALAKQGVDCDYVWPARQSATGYAVTIDATRNFAEPVLPEAVLARRPVLVTGEHSVNYLLDASHQQMIAYVKNTAEYKFGPGYGSGVQELHRQRTKTSPLTLEWRGFPAGRRYRVYDVDERRVVAEGKCPAAPLSLGETSHDFAIVVY